MGPRPGRRQGAAAQALALLTVTLLFVWLWLRTDMHYALGDDFYLARAFAGEVGGVAESYNAYIHTFFAWLLHGLTVLFPGQWWFSWLEVALLALGSYGVSLGLMRLCRRLGGPLWLGWLAGTLFLFAFTVEFSTSITFTTTTAVLGAGAVCLLGGADLRRGGKGAALELLGSAALLWCAYLLRAVSVLPGAAFWLGLLLYRLLKNAGAEKEARFPWRPALCGLLAAGLLFGLSIGVRAAENAMLPEPEKEYVEFLDATVVPIDYGGLAKATPETLARLGWTDATLAMVRSWYFMDSSMSAASFRAIEADAVAAEAPPLLQRLKDGKARLLRLLSSSDNVRFFLLICLGLCLAAFLAAAFGKRGNLWGLLAPLGCGGLTLALLAYLALEGRLPMRAAATVLLPASAMALCLAAEELGALGPFPGVKRLLPASGKGGAALSGSQKRRAEFALLRALPALLVLGACTLLALAAAHTAFGFYYNPGHGDPNQCAYAGVDGYVLAHEDKLFIGDRTLGVDRRLFPSRSAGVPTNLLPMWGGWNNHSAGYRAAFARYGLKHDDFSVTQLLGQTVRLITGPEGPSPELAAYLAQQAGAAVEPVQEAQGDGYCVYGFRLVS